jgi:hypothetical protein
MLILMWPFNRQGDRTTTRVRSAAFTSGLLVTYVARRRRSKLTRRSSPYRGQTTWNRPPPLRRRRSLRDPSGCTLGEDRDARARPTGYQKQLPVMSIDLCTGHALPQWSQHRAFPLETNLQGPSAGDARALVAGHLVSPTVALALLRC